MEATVKPGSAYDRWIDQWNDEQWAALPEHRRRMLTTSAIRRELYGEVAAAVAPFLLRLRERWSMWQIAASLTPIEFTVNSLSRTGSRIACTRLYLFWVLDEYASHLPDAMHTPELEQAMLCEHGTRDWCGSTYCGCDDISDAIDQDGEMDPEQLQPGYEWVEGEGWVDRCGYVKYIRARMHDAFRRAMDRGYSYEELTLLLSHAYPAEHYDKMGADMLWRVGLEANARA